MNAILKPLLRKTILVFFDDILVSSTSWEEHLSHFRTIFENLRQQTLFVKENKCTFGTKQVESLGHAISKGTIAMDQAKIESIMNWPMPTCTKDLRGFLGLTGYYKRFIRNYGLLARPLTDLLKKNT